MTGNIGAANASTGLNEVVVDRQRSVAGQSFLDRLTSPLSKSVTLAQELQRERNRAMH